MSADIKPTVKPDVKADIKAETDSLSSKIQALREKMMLHPAQLAKKAAIPLETLEQIEEGTLLFLSPALRMRLARCLRVKPGVLEALEKRPSEDAMEEMVVHALMRRISREPDAAYACPRCRQPLVVKTVLRRDLEDNPVTATKATCSQCVFYAEEA